MTEEERTSVFTAPDFLDFVEQSTKIIQRALNDNYDYTRDYTIGTETGGYNHTASNNIFLCSHTSYL